MPSVVISQSMYFPWVGLLEQVRLADTFVHYDDVQFDRGFYNRVQVKTPTGMRWITIPLSNHRRGQTINDIALDDGQGWRRSHRGILQQAYSGAPFAKDMLGLVDGVFAGENRTLAEVTRASLLALVDYFGLRGSRRFLDSRDFAPAQSSSHRLLAIVRAVGGDHYITGHGARNYLDHDLFEQAGVRVSYMSYEKRPYPQLHGPFVPFVSALDLVANCGTAGADVIASKAIDWRRFVQENPG
jgi:hypothetical protein